MLTSTTATPIHRTSVHETFEKWLVNDANVVLHPSVRFLTTGKRGIVTTGVIEKDQVLAKIPLTSCISSETTEPHLPTTFMEYSELVRLSIFLDDVLRSGSESRRESSDNPSLSFWYPFVQWMSIPNTPMLWNEQDLNNYMNGTSLLGEILLRQNLTFIVGLEIQKKLELARVVPEQQEEQEEQEEQEVQQHANKREPLPSRLLWGMAMVQSRVHKVPQKVLLNEEESGGSGGGIDSSGGDGQWNSIKMLVPFADALNTGRDPNVDCYTNEESTHFVCSTNQRVLSNIPLTSSYGGVSQGRAMYALNYGFVDDNWMTLNEYIWLNISGSVVAAEEGSGGGIEEKGETEKGGVEEGGGIEEEGGGGGTSVLVHDGVGLEKLVLEKKFSWMDIIQGIETKLQTLYDSYKHAEVEAEAEAEVEVAAGNGGIGDMESMQSSSSSKRMKAQLGNYIRDAEIATLLELLNYSKLALLAPSTNTAARGDPVDEIYVIN